MIVEPGSTIGILGGGQLGRMLAIAAAQLGYRCHIFAPEETPPAADVSAEVTRGSYADAEALRRFGAAVDVVTYEFENVDAGPIEELGRCVSVYPPVKALEIAQDRLLEKDFVSALGGRTAPYRTVNSIDDLRPAVADLGAPSILKTRRFGYDGKGQARIQDRDEAETAWRSIGEQSAVLEGFVRFEHEFSILLARAIDGSTVIWDAPDNLHRSGILDVSCLPSSPVVREQAGQAAALATKVAGALDYVGVLTLEFFASDEGPIFNEMAPRVHNSGHWTIEGARTSQFENHIRAICGLPLGATDLAASRVEMRNLIGGDVHDWHQILTDPNAHLHLYGKGEARPGRKMGHVTYLGYDNGD